MDRSVVTQKIIEAKVRKGMTWRDIAKSIGESKEWVTAGCLGQMTFTKAQAEAAGKLFELTDEEMAWLQIVPYKGSLPTAVPTDPLIYRWYEIVSVYGTTIKELIHNFSVNSDFREVWNITIKDVGIKIGILQTFIQNL